jgi:hypothetical protein
MFWGGTKHPLTFYKFRGLYVSFMFLKGPLDIIFFWLCLAGFLSTYHSLKQTFDASSYLRLTQNIFSSYNNHPF